MINYNPGDVVLVTVPFTNQASNKKRPAVVVSSKSYNQKNPDLIVLPITSKTHEPSFYGEFSITKWKNAGLLKPSYGKPLLASVEKSIVLKTLGAFEEEDLDSLKKSLKNILI